MMNRLATAAAALTLATAAGAQSLPGVAHEGTAITLAYNFHDNGIGDPYDENYTGQLTLRSSFAFSENFRTTLILGFNEETYLDSYYSGRHFIGLQPEYDFGNVTLGAYAIAGRHKLNGGGQDSERFFGLTGAYDDGRWLGEAYLGRYDDSNSERSTGGLAAGYQFGSGISLYGFHRRDSFPGNDWNGLSGLGVSYALDSAFDNVPLDLTAEVSRFHDENTSIGESDWPQVSLMATYRFGTPRKSVFRGIYNVDYFYD